MTETICQDGAALRGKQGGISGSTVKLVGIITMFLDHFAGTLLARILISGGWTDELYWIYFILRMVGRLGFPIFCFLLVEGFEKTRSRGKYALRLGLFSLLSEIPFDLALSAKVLEFGYQNVYFTLFLGMLALCTCDFLEKHCGRKSGSLPRWACWPLFFGGCIGAGWHMAQYAGNLLPGIFREDAGWIPFGIFSILAALVLLCYGQRGGAGRPDKAGGAGLENGMEKGERKEGEGKEGRKEREEREERQESRERWDKMLTAGADLAAVSLFMWLADLLRTDYSGMGVLTIAVMYFLRKSKVRAMAGGCVVLTCMAFNELPAFLALIPVSRYNGTRGWKLKYFFYIFYPAHLFLLWAVAWFLGMGGIPVV